MRPKTSFPLLPTLGLGLVVVALTIVPAARAVGLLPNGSFETFQSYNGEVWRGFPEGYGQGWTVTVLDEDDGSLHFMDSDTFGWFIAAVYGQGYLNYHLEGGLAQVAASRYHFDFVLSQTVPVQAGQAYAFGGKIVSFYAGSGPPVDHTQILKRIGLDPTGGAAWNAPTVVWTDWDGLDNAWTSPALAARAETDQMTVFIQVKNLKEDVGSAYLNTVFIDSFKFELAPTVDLNLPDTANPDPIQISWQANISDGYWNLWGYDVEYRQEPDGPWQVLQVHNSGDKQNEAYTFNDPQPDQTYTFRVRPWQQRAPNGDTSVTALPGVWTEKSVAVQFQQAIIGRVVDHRGLPVSGVTVTASGVITQAVSQPGGSFVIPTGADGQFAVTAAAPAGLVAPPPAVVTVSPAGPATLVITLRPGGENQGLSDNDFEAPSAAWQNDSGGAVTLSTEASHSGSSSLQLDAGDSAMQVNSVTGMDDPMLSFWYKGETPVTVQFLGPGDTVISEKTLGPAANWIHTRLKGYLGEDYSGSIGVKFVNTAGSGSAFVDEASIGPGGLVELYLPLILGNQN